MYNWIDQHKNDNNGLVNFLKVIYAMGINKFVNPIVNAVLGIFIPVFIDLKLFWLSIFSLAFLVGSITLNVMCVKYKEYKNKQQQIAYEVLENQNSLLNTINIEIKSNPQWKSHIFKKTSEIVCEKIQHLFKETLHCVTRVSIEYVFEKTLKDKTEKHVKMSGRRSPNRDTCKGSKPLESRNKYFSYNIFTNKRYGISILSESDITSKRSKWFTNPKHKNDIKEYIGIAVSVKDENSIDFILQIDCLHTMPFGKHSKTKEETEAEIQMFINTYLKSYIDLVGLSYLLNLNKNKNIPEV